LPSTICFANQPLVRKYGLGKIVSALSAELYLERNNLLLGNYEVSVPKDQMQVEPQVQRNNRK
jgi:hypothetical protein